ncbi:MAG: hypothetical protein PHE67_00920 [Campylobacterales bacterium]|nr:hypothetical protein [Campylobacterales bacterium]
MNDANKHENENTERKIPLLANILLWICCFAAGLMFVGYGIEQKHPRAVLDFIDSLTPKNDTSKENKQTYYEVLEDLNFSVKKGDRVEAAIFTTDKVIVSIKTELNTSQLRAVADNDVLK